MFFIVIRLFLSPNKNNSMELFYVSDYDSVDACVRAAEARFHNIITADLQNENVIYQMAAIMDNAGNFLEKPVVFDRRETPEPEEE